MPGHGAKGHKLPMKGKMPPKEMGPKAMGPEHKHMMPGNHPMKDSEMTGHMKPVAQRAKVKAKKR